MKIALVSPYDLRQPGGVNAHVLNLARALAARGADARVIAAVSRGLAMPDHVIPITRRVATLASGGARARITLDPRVIWRLRALVRHHRFDVVHVHNPLSPLVSLSVLAARPAASSTLFVGTFHEYRERLNPVMELAKRMLRPWVDRLDARIAVSPAALAFNQRRFPGPYTLIPNGVDVARFAGDRTSDGATVLFVGRLEPRKGFRHLLDAYARLVARRPVARLIVAGPYDRTVADSFRRDVSAHGLRRVEFLGEVADEALPALYRAADVFCAPSVDFESFGIVLLEAMAAGVPIVASDIAGYRSVIEHGRHGLLVPPGNAEALAGAIEVLLADPARRRAMAAAGRAHVQAFDWPLVAGRVLDFYEAMLVVLRARVSPITSSAAASIPLRDP